MILLDCSWQNVIDGIPCLCWGVIFLIALYWILQKIALYLILKYVEQPKNQHQYEEESKQKAFEREEKWDLRKDSKAQTLQKVEELEKQLETLKEALYGK